MQTKALLVCCIALMLPSAGTVSKPAGCLPADSSSARSNSPSEGDRLYRRAMALVSRGEYLEAVEVNRAGRKQAEAQGDSRLALRFLNNLGNCWYVLSRYRRAMEAYLEARTLAERLGQWEISCAVSLNISSLSLLFGDVDGAAAAAARGWRDSGRLAEAKFRFPLLMQMGKVKAYQGDLAGATEYFRQAVWEADRQGDLAMQAQACGVMGYELLRQGRTEAAERPLLEAFRLRKLRADRDLENSYLSVGLLRTAQGDLAAADVLFSRAIALAADKPGLAPLWSAYYFRGQGRMLGNRPAEALEDYRRAVDLARRWRLDALPADATRVGADVQLQELYAGLIQAANQLYRQTHRPALLEASFEAAEENRAASLRALIADRAGAQPALPDEYGQTLARLRAAEVALLRKDSPAARQQAQRLRGALTEMEARTGLDSGRAPEPANSAGLGARTRRALEPDEALISFHLGEPQSYVWAIAREGVELHELPGRNRLGAQLQQFATAVRSGSASAMDLGQNLYTILFGALAPRTIRQRHWALAVEDVLFRTPLAALVVERGPMRPVYLIERHSIRFVPSAYGVAERRAGRAKPGRSERFVGLGDPVYNAADPRWRGAHGRGADSSLHLARLPGSGREIRACAAAWSGPSPPVLLEGAAASRQELSRALAGAPAVVHLATHVVARPSQPTQSLLALGLLPGGEPDFLTPADIAAWRTEAGLVVLSGCGSGAGETLPGAGLMGLTRAWLATGAGAVAATLWPAPDDSGELFLSFYRHLHQGQAVAAWRRSGAASALAAAQTGMVEPQSWRSDPKYWAGYFVFGRE